MFRIRQFFVICFFVSAFIFASASAANAQLLIDYLFLEVVDSNGKPVADATVEISRANWQSMKTDEEGRARFEFSSFKVSKPGYFSFQDLGAIQSSDSNETFFTLELLKIPQTKNERRILGKEQLKREFMWAAKNGDAAAVRRLLKSGVNPNITTDDLRGVPSPKNIPAIIFAAMSGDSETVKVFLQAGVDVRTKEEPIRSILAYYLHAASYANRRFESDAEKAKWTLRYEDGVKSLIKAGSNINDLYGYGVTALMIAAQRGYAGVVKILLEKGLPVNARSKSGDTALMGAVHNAQDATSPQFEVISLLIKSGADPNMVGYSDALSCRTPLMDAAEYGKFDVMKLLIANKADVNLVCGNLDSVLYYAIRSGKAGILQFALDAGASAKGEFGQRLLSYALWIHADSEIIELLKAAMDK